MKLTNLIFKKPVIFSLFGHLALFALFSFSFGQRISKINSSPIYLWGQIFPRYEMVEPLKKNISASRLNPSILGKVSNDFFTLNGALIKPQTACVYVKEKSLFAPELKVAPFDIRRKEPSVTFHPFLPQSFPLYFQDRQIAHVELLFNVVTDRHRRFINIKRRVSSGNLEVDLLSMRYMSHYLFIQQSRFLPNSWQVVKVDLSAKND